MVEKIKIRLEPEEMKVLNSGAELQFLLKEDLILKIWKKK